MASSDGVIFLLKDSGDLEKVPVKSYDSEDLLQSLIEKYPELLAGDQINPEEPTRWIMVKREAGVPGGEQQGDRWAIDHLLLDQNAVPTFVETKRSSDTRIRREVVGQMLDYAANAQRYWPVGHIRSVTEAQYGGAERAAAVVMELLGFESGVDVAADLEAYWTKVEDNLRHGRLRLIFIADRLPPELRRIIEFLNGQMEETEVLGIELAQYVGSDLRALVPRVIGQTEVARMKKQATGGGKTIITEEQFFNFLRDRVDAEDVEFARQIMEDVQRLGCVIDWKQASFVIKLPDPRGSGQSLSLLVVEKGGQVYARNEFHSQLDSLGLPTEIASDYAREAAELFSDCRIREGYVVRWSRTVSLSELRQRYQEFRGILEKTIGRIKEASQRQ